MPGYTAFDKQASFDDSRAEQYRAEIARADTLVLTDAASLYLSKVRGIPSATFMPCQDLRLLPSPIPDRPPTNWACVSLLRPAPDAAPTGAELTFIDILGHPTATEPRRVQWAFVEHGCRNSWFWAGGSGARAYIAEGFLAKPLAILSVGVPGWVMGWGPRSWLQFKAIPPADIQTIVICPDRQPT
jgi:hypothetical protein